MAAGGNRAFNRPVNDFEQNGDGWLQLAAPAKVNLMLSVHGRRADGFHELTSVVAALDFGDELELRSYDLQNDTLVSDGVEIPTDNSNLVLKAAELFRKHTGRKEFFDFRLQKRIPVGAGLGGGSSDGVAALKGMDALLGTGLSPEELRTISAGLGSDCPFFVDAVPSVMRGRGECIEPLDAAAASRLAGQRLVLFRPDFGINTAWAYGQLVSSPEFYEDAAQAEARLQAFADCGNCDGLLQNVFEAAVGRKYLAIACLLEKLRRLGYHCMMSGSGSACFALVYDDEAATELNEICRNCWGENTFWVETSFLRRKM